MQFYRIVDQTFPTIQEIRQQNPGVGIPDNPADLTDLGYQLVLTTEPVFDPKTQRVAGPLPPIRLETGEWVQQWNIVEIPPAEIEQNLTQIRDAIWESIKAERDRRKGQGVQVNGKWFQSDDASRIQYLSLKMMGSSMPNGIMWKTMDNSFVPMTPDLVTQIFNASVIQDQAIFANAEQHRLNMQAAEDPAIYNYMTGWPQAFQ